MREGFRKTRVLGFGWEGGWGQDQVGNLGGDMDFVLEGKMLSYHFIGGLRLISGDGWSLIDLEI